MQINSIAFTCHQLMTGALDKISSDNKIQYIPPNNEYKSATYNSLNSLEVFLEQSKIFGGDLIAAMILNIINISQLKMESDIEEGPQKV